LFVAVNVVVRARRRRNNSLDVNVDDDKPALAELADTANLRLETRIGVVIVEPTSRRKGEGAEAPPTEKARIFLFESKFNYPQSADEKNRKIETK